MAATTQKTIEYMLPMLGSGGSAGIASSTTHTDSADTTLYIPESTDRTFKSVTLKVSVNDCYGTAGNDLAAWSVRVSCDAGSNFTTVTRTTTLADTGENFPLIITADVTAEFIARFAGASDTCRWGLYLSFAAGSIWSNATATLVITYEYNAASHTTAQVKTVRIPIESFNGRLSNALQQIRQGTIVDQLPALAHASTPFLPEASVAIRQAFCELWCNTLPSTTTDTYLYVDVDGGGETQSGIVENGPATPMPFRFLLDVTAVDWTDVRTLNARHGVSSQSYFLHLGGWLTVTYEYNPSTSTTILNSLLMGLGETLTEVKVSADKSMYSMDFYVEDPATVTLVQSGVFVVFNAIATSDTLTFKCGAQTATGYTPTSGGNLAGQVFFTHRIDSGGYRGAGITLARGKNTLTVEYYIGTAGRISAPSVKLILNYTSGKSGSYGEANTRTVHYIYKDQSTTPAATYKAAIGKVPSIIEDYYLVNLSHEIRMLPTGTTVAGLSFYVERQSGEGVAAGWEELCNVATTGVAEVGPMIGFVDNTGKYRRYANDPITKRMNLETARDYYLYCRALVTQLAVEAWVTYHAMTFTISGTISNSNGGTVNLYLHRASDGELLLSTSRVGNGAYSFTWYDSAENVFVQAYEDSTHIGRSANGTGS
jgi:hypothetical protein